MVDDSLNARPGIAPTAARDDARAAVRGVLDQAARLGVRALMAGGPVFVVHGLISPRPSPSTNLIIDPAGETALLGALGADGWAPAPVRPSLAPGGALGLRHGPSGALLNLYPLLPGFGVHPAVVFEHLWKWRVPMRAFDRDGHAVDRLVTMILAVHDNLGPRAAAPPPESVTAFLIDHFLAEISNDELERLPVLIDGLGAQAVMRRFCDALGLPPMAARMPSRAYAAQRWARDDVDPGDRLLLASLDATPGYRGAVQRDVRWARRWMLARGPFAVPHLLGTLLGASRRRRRRLRDALGLSPAAGRRAR